jgi:hypothetical protein
MALGAFVGLALGIASGFGTFIHMPIPLPLAWGWFLGGWLKGLVAGGIVGGMIIELMPARNNMRPNTYQPSPSQERRSSPSGRRQKRKPRKSERDR